jgi:alpha-L-rhamnosidase
MISGPTNLRCEYLTNPLGIDTRAPRFSWNLRHGKRNQSQSAYQIIVSSSLDDAENEIGLCWDSGRVESDENVNVVYDGAPLASTSLYYWRVRWWDADGNESAYSEVFCFDTGFLDEGDWKASWISMKNPTTFQSGIHVLFSGVDRDSPQYHAIYMRKTFAVGWAVKRAFAYVCGLGYYELRLNGEKVGDYLLDPGETDFKKAALYSAFDVTESLRAGENAIGIILGNGRHVKAFGYGKPRGIVELHIEFEDGQREVVLSDDDWKTSHGPIMENGTYLGERYDARREMPGWDAAGFDDSQWEQAETVDGPPLAAQMMAPLRATHTLKPQKILRPEPGVFVYDFGQNFTGWVRLSVTGPAGTEVSLSFAELLDSDGMLNVSTRRNAEATDKYVLKGEGEEVYEPRFTYHGFRYVEMRGFPGVPTLESLEGIFVHSDVEPIGKFSCSNKLINDIHRNIWWGQLCNLMSIPLDCPQRDERMGWMGDAHLSAEEAFYNFHMAPFYFKYLRDIGLAQKDDGSLSDVIPPYWPLYPSDPAWGSAYISLAWYCYQFTGDTRALEEQFDGMQMYVEFLKSNTEDNVLNLFGRYGDWCAPGCIQPMKTPAALTSTWYYYHDTLLLSRIADVLGRHAEAARYSALTEEIRDAFNNEFLNGNRYASNNYGLLTYAYISQTSQTLPLYLDMTPEDQREGALKMLKQAVVDQSDCHVDTGIVGTRYLLDVLTANGMAAIAYKVATQRSYPSWGYMIEEGATTLWERWEKLEGQGMNSHNHIMLGSVDAWFYRVIAGLAPAEPGWKRIRIKPHILGDLTHATATVKTIRGEVHVSWEKGEAALNFNVGLPANTLADVYVPLVDRMGAVKEGGNSIWAGGKAAEAVSGITTVGEEGEYLHLIAGSGFYEFEISA